MALDFSIDKEEKRGKPGTLHENDNANLGMKQPVADMLSEQMGMELESSQIYIGMAVWCDQVSLLGASSWFMKQGAEEYTHYQKLLAFAMDCGNSITLHPINGVETEFDSLLDCFAKTVEHEKTVWRSLQKIYDAALKANDVEVRVLLEGFLQEQIEEVRTVTNVYNRLKLVGTDGTGILLIDQELGKR